MTAIDIESGRFPVAFRWRHSALEHGQIQPWECKKELARREFRVGFHSGRVRTPSFCVHSTLAPSRIRPLLNVKILTCPLPRLGCANSGRYELRKNRSILARSVAIWLSVHWPTPNLKRSALQLWNVYNVRSPNSNLFACSSSEMECVVANTTNVIVLQKGALT